MRVMHVHRIRGIGGSERHLLTLLAALVFVGATRYRVAWDFLLAILAAAALARLAERARAR